MRTFFDSPIALWDGLEGLTQLADDEKDGWQWAIVGGALLLGFLLSLLMARTIFATGTRCRGACERFFKPTREFGGVPLSGALLLWIAYVCGQNEFGGNREVLHTAALLATGFAVYRLAVALSKGQWVPRMIGIAALITVGLNLVGVLDSFLFSLQNYHLPLGDLRINPWAIFSGVLALFLLLWLANLSSRFLDAGL
ncbi:MAG: hypothetical protein ABGZ49_09430, partial [Akkermansiaceae bacterium]